MLPLSSAYTKLWVGEYQPRNALRNSSQLPARSIWSNTPRSWDGRLPAHQTDVVCPRSEMTGPCTLHFTSRCSVAPRRTGISYETFVYCFHPPFQKYMPGCAESSFST